MKLKRLKWQNLNLENWNEKWWNLECEFCIFGLFLKKKNFNQKILIPNNCIVVHNFGPNWWVVNGKEVDSRGPTTTPLQFTASHMMSCG